MTAPTHVSPSGSASMSVGPRLRIRVSPRDIPPLSEAVMEILKLANDPNVSRIALERGISRDQSLTLRVLTIANSSFYGCSRQVDSVKGAVALLGTQQIQSIASALALAPAFDSKAGPSLWRHALSCALWTRAVVQALGLPDIPHLFTAGLMHDMGLVFLLKKAPERVAECITHSKATGEPFHLLERRLLGSDHADLASRTCKMWKLPDNLAEVIALHHDPSEDNLESSVLALADRLSTATGTPEFGWMDTPMPDQPYLSEIHLGELDLDQLLKHTERISEEAAAFG